MNVLECPWCKEDCTQTIGNLIIDYEGIPTYAKHTDTCPHCHQPILLELDFEIETPRGIDSVSVDDLKDLDAYIDVRVRPDEAAVKAEREKYEKRMRGDWS